MFKDKILYRFAKRKEIQELISLSSIIYNKPVSCEYFKWFYDYFDSIDNSITVAETDGKIVALQPFTVLSLVINNEEWKVAFLTGVGTHPDYRRRGIFSSLIEYTSKVLSDRGDIKFAYTFPNEFSFPGFIKLEGWKLFGELNLYIKPLKFYSTITGFLKSLIEGLSKAERKEVDNETLYWSNTPNFTKKENDFFIINEFGSEFDNFWNSVKDDFNISIKKDSKYLNWRYIDNPQRDRYFIFGYKINSEVKGYIILKKEILFNCTSGIIVDIVSADNKTTDLLIKEAIKFFKNEKLTISGFAGLPGERLDKALKRNDYLVVPNRFSPKQFRLVYKPLKDDISFNIKEWKLSWCDTDLL